MSEFDQEINLDEVLKQVEELSSKQAERTEKLDDLRKQIVAAEELLSTLRSERDTITREKQQDRMSLLRLEKEAERRKRLKATQEEKVRLQTEFMRLSEQLDMETADAPWRTFAFDHQISGGKRLAVAKRGILADKRGLGKTLTSLVWLDMVKAKRIIVFAPNDVVPQFEEEIRMWQPHRTIFSLRGLNKDARALIYPMLRMVKEFIITLNYEAWRKDKTIIDDLVAAGIDSIICDEAHRIKSSTKITARGVFQVAYRPNVCTNGHIANHAGTWGGKDVYDGVPCSECGSPTDTTVKNVLTMTGTPILNKPQELFSMLHLVDRNRYSSERDFLDDYCYSYGPNRWAFMAGGLDRLTKHMSEFFVQRNREDAGIHVPPPAVKVYYVEKDKVKYAKQYEAERQLREGAAMVLENGEAVSMLYILEIILRERQIMTWPAGVTLKIKEQNPDAPNYGEVIKEFKFDVEESQKLDEAADLLQDLLDEEERVIIFSKFKAPLYELKRRFPEKTVMATGNQAIHVKDAIRRDFDLKTADKENPRWNACFATYDAFGTGINLNAARHIIMLDDEWNPGMEDQAIGRIDRLNSVDQANVHIFRVKNSIDDFMEALLEEKKKLTEGFESTLTAQDLLSHLKDV